MTRHSKVQRIDMCQQDFGLRPQPHSQRRVDPGNALSSALGVGACARAAVVTSSQRPQVLEMKQR